MEALCVLLSYGIMVEDYGISPLGGFLETLLRKLARGMFATASESHPDLLIGNQVLCS